MQHHHSLPWWHPPAKLRTALQRNHHDMAQRPRRDDINRLRSSSPPSFLSLPDIVHHNIVSFLHDDDVGGSDRLQVSETSRALLEPYGGSALWLYIHQSKGASAPPLRGLLGRQKKLKELIVETEEAVGQGDDMQGWRPGNGLDPETYCRRAPLLPKLMDAMVGAFAVEGALPVLHSLELNCRLTRPMLMKLGRSLAGGTRSRTCRI